MSYDLDVTRDGKSQDMSLSRDGVKAHFQCLGSEVLVKVSWSRHWMVIQFSSSNS